MMGNVELPDLFLLTGDANFADLFGGRKLCDGILVPRGMSGPDCNVPCTFGASVVITGPPGSGKTLLACQLSLKTVRHNDEVRAKTSEMTDSFWPKNSLVLYYTSDQTADEISSLSKSFGWVKGNQIAIQHSLDSVVRSIEASEPREETKFIITEMPHQTSVDELWKHLQMNVGPKMKGRPAIVVIDSINNVMKEKDGYYINFRELVKLTKSSGLPHVNLLLVLEEDEKTRFSEEYVPQCVIRLGRGKGLAAGRTIEISKARQQAPLIGEHEFSVYPLLGMKVYPSVSSRASQWRNHPTEKGTKIQRQPIDFGNSQIDKKLQERPSARLHSGSTTLIWGPPGTRKTDLCVEFASGGLGVDDTSSILLLTTKIDPDVFEKSLDLECSKRRIETNNRQYLTVVDARDPYRTPASILAEVVDDVDEADSIGNPVKRAVVFGLSLLEDTPSTRDEQWRFISVLVGFFESQNIATVLVDWPIEGVAGSDKANSRPRASKLCGTEIKMELRNKDKAEKGFPRINLLRANYTAIGAEIDYRSSEDPSD
jgi:KaiC/GvpD/RAD55 family RecA-like ATPase